MTISLIDTLTMTVAAASAVECVIGRIAAMQWRQHRPSIMLSYLAGAGICLLAASSLWQGADARWLDVSAWVIAAHLAITWRAWRHGAPTDAQREINITPARAAWQHTRDDGRWHGP